MALRFEKHNKLCWVITVLIAILIFFVSSLEFAPGGYAGSNFKSMAYHVSVFFFFAFFLTMALARGKSGRAIVLAIVLAVIYGISDELHQFFVPGRAMSLSDIFLDSIGVIFAAMSYFIVIKIQRQ